MTKKKNAGLDWLVTGRGYAMIMIYIAHLMLAYLNQGNSSIVPVGKVIEVMLVPFFVVLSGAFYSKSQSSFFQYFKLKFSQRYIPVVFYALLSVPFYFLFSDSMFDTASRWWPAYFIGIPMLNWPTWFLIGLFSAELIFYFMQKACWKKSTSLFIALLLFIIGCIFNAGRAHFNPLLDALSMMWMLHSVPLFLAFMLVGISYKREILRLSRWPTKKVFAALIPTMAVLIIFSLLNTNFPDNSQSEGLRSALRSDIVIIFVGQYGNPLFFLISSMSGVASFFLLARILPPFKWVRWIGDHSMLLLGLNGIFHQSINAHIIHYFPLPANHLGWVFLYTSIEALLSILIVLPLVILLQKTLPQLVGKPMINGPILPAIYRKKSAGN